MVKDPVLEELIAKPLVGLASHSVFVHEGLENLPDVLLAEYTIAPG